MTSRQKQLVENYIRTKVRSMLKEEDGFKKINMVQLQKVYNKILNSIETEFDVLDSEEKRHLATTVTEFLKRYIK